MAQNTLKITVKDTLINEPLIGANAFIAQMNKGAISNEQGEIYFESLANGVYSLNISHVGYVSKAFTFNFIRGKELQQKFVYLFPQTEEIEEIILVSTMSSRTIADIPTRVEVIAGEELSEKGNMKLGDIRMLLNESTGIRTQQTSATSYNSSIRIQGLDGKYTQLLRDGFPLYSGFASGLSLMQIAPLDLKQVEVVKGSSSTLFGGGAIASLVNLKIKYGDFKLFTGYTNADVKQYENGLVSDFPLVAKHRLNNVLMFEKEENLWVGLEAYYYSPQQLSNGNLGQSFWIMGLMSEKKLGDKFSIFLNFENFLDTRQSRFGLIYSGNITNPQFRDIYAPVDGFVINGGFKLNL